MDVAEYPEDRWVESSGVRLHALDWGGEGEAMVFLAGYGNTPHFFDRLARRFTRGHRVLGLTRRAHGRSGQPSSGYDIQSLADDVLEFLDAMELDRAVLVGHSFAGYEMTCLAANHPDRISKLVYLDALYAMNEERIRLLVDNPVRASTPPPETFATVAEYSEDFVTRYAAYRRLRSPEWDAFMAHALEATADGRVREVLRPDAGRQLGEAMMEYELKLSEISCPVLAIFAFQDETWLLPDEASDELRRATRAYVVRLHAFVRAWEETVRREIADVRIVELNDTSHYCFLDREAEVFAAMGAFLGSKGSLR